MKEEMANAIELVDELDGRLYKAMANNQVRQDEAMLEAWLKWHKETIMFVNAVEEFLNRNR